MTRLLRPYRALIAWLVALGLLGNLTILALPALIGRGVNGYTQTHTLPTHLSGEFIAAAGGILIFAYLQSLVQVYASERVARDLRARLADSLSRQTAAFVAERQPARLLTNLTSDVDAVKQFVAQAIPSLVSSTVILAGATVLLLRMDVRLGLAVLSIVPLIGLTFFLVLRRVRPLFKATREAVDRLNQVITQSILGAALIRVLHAQEGELQRFGQANGNSRDLGLRILGHFATMIPCVAFLSNLAQLTILVYGGWLGLPLGDLAAFLSYLAILIFPIFVIGFMTNIISQAQASYVRLAEVLDAPVPPDRPFGTGGSGAVEVRDLCLNFGERCALRHVNLKLRPGTRNAILGPTAAGKTQLLYVMAGLVEPTSGEVVYEGDPRVALVFQESILFHTTLAENLGSRDPALLETVELADFVATLPEGLETIVSERGTSLSGGQKQR